MSFGTFLYQHGSRPGSLILADHYEDTTDYLKWGVRTYKYSSSFPNMNFLAPRICRLWLG